MAENNNNVNPFITVPAGVFKAAMANTSKEAGLPMLRAVHVEGAADGNGMRVDVVATDSYSLFHASYNLGADGFGMGGVEGIDKVSFDVEPTDKLGNCGALRIELLDGGAVEVTEYAKAKARAAITSMAAAAAAYKPTSYHRWGTVDGKYPDWRQLMPKDGTLNAAAGFNVEPDRMAAAFKTLKDATGVPQATFEGMAAKDKSKYGGPLLFSAMDINNGVRAEVIVMPQASDGLVVGAQRGETVTKAAYDDMCALYRKHALRADELEKELAALKEQTPDAEYELDLRKRFQERNLELVEKVEQLEAEIAELKEQKAHEPEEVAAIVKAEQPAVPAIEDDGVFLTIDTSMVQGYIVRSKDGSPLALATQNGTNAWLQGDMKALGDAIKGTFPEVRWSSKRRAFWAKIA